MKRPETMIREYEADNPPHTQSLRLYTYVRPRRNGEATVEIWGARNKRNKKKSLGCKCFFRFRTESDSYRVKDVLRYTSWCSLQHDHLCYSCPEIGGTDYYRYAMRMCGGNWDDDVRGRWLTDRVSKTNDAFLPSARLLNGFDGTKYRWCGYRGDSGWSVMRYLDFWKRHPKAEIISKSGNFQLLDEKFMTRLETDADFARYVARGHHEITLHHLERPAIERLFRKGADIREYSKMLIAEQERMRREREEEERKDMQKAMERDRKWDANILALYNRIKSVCGIYGCYEVVVPKTSAEMYEEGLKMHNCVGRVYASRHGNGDDIVVFLRKDGKPYVDMRIDPKTFAICECRFVCNKDAMRDESVMAEAQKVRSGIESALKEVA